MSNAYTDLSGHRLVKQGKIGSYACVPLELPTSMVAGSLWLVDVLPGLGSAQLDDQLVRYGRALAGLLAPVGNPAGVVCEVPCET